MRLSPKIIGLWLAIASLTGSPAAMAEYNVFSEKITPVVEWSAEGNKTLFPDQTYTPVSTFQGATYVVWADPQRRPRVTRIQGNNIVSGRLDPNDDYQARDDGHHKFSLGIDNDGYIHVIGDMHHHPYSNADHLPLRYQKTAAMYWVSSKPADVSSFEFMGDKPQRCPPGSSFSYYYFDNDTNGVLYFAARVRSGLPLGGWKPGAIGYGIYRYDTKTKTWEALGGLMPGAKYKLVAWENNGSKATAYQSMRADIRFDANNRLHFATTINNDDSITPDNMVHMSMTHVLYGYSDDDGATFHRADGSPIESLPMRADPGPDQADIIAGPEHWLSMPAAIEFTKDNRPFVTYAQIQFQGNKGKSTAMYRLWQGKNGWTAPAPLALNAYGWDKHATDRRGVITLSAMWPGTICRTMHPGQPGKVHQLRFGCFDRRYLRETGELRGIAGENTSIRVIRLDIR